MPTAAAGNGGNGGTLEEIERRHICDTLERSGWVIDGPHGAAAALAMRPSTLRSRMKRLGVIRPS
jgi:transcriptional regulator with GAF, ATPase, and Fis domain